MTAKFETGRTYSTRSICDSNCWWTFEIVRRTAKSVWIREVGETEVTRRAIRVSQWEVGAQTEVFSPFGRYSMSPTVTADRNVDRNASRVLGAAHDYLARSNPALRAPRQHKTKEEQQ